MDSSAIKKVNKEVFQRHPQMAGINPKVSQQTADRYLLVYSKTIEIATGRNMQQTIRVTADKQGNVLKMSVSKS